MQRSKIVTLGILGALLVAAAFGAVAYRSASAAQAIADGTDMALLDAESHHAGGIAGVTDEDLADALGITVEGLTAAREQARTAALEQAVADGLITQAQADALTSGERVFPFGRGWGGFLGENGIDFQSYLAEALGITVDELNAAQTQAFTDKVNQAVADGSLTQEQADLILGRRLLFSDTTFQASMQSAFESGVNAAVASGVITQAQADQILANSNGMWARGMGGFGGFGGGMGGGHHGRGGFGDMPLAEQP